MGINSFLGVLFAVTLGLARQDNHVEAISMVMHAAAIFGEFVGSSESPIPPGVLAEAVCLGIFPGVKNSYGPGAELGEGIVICRTRRGWSAPSTMIIKGHIGPKTGPSATDVLLIFRTENSRRKLMQGKLNIGPGLNLTPGPVGFTNFKETERQKNAAVLFYSRREGRSGNADVSDVTLKADPAANFKVYRRRVRQRDILQGEIAPPGITAGLYDILQQYAPAG